eukprot:2016530-Rhodomonas_salina.2
MLVQGVLDSPKHVLLGVFVCKLLSDFFPKVVPHRPSNCIFSSRFHSIQLVKRDCACFRLC